MTRLIKNIDSKNSSFIEMGKKFLTFFLSEEEYGIDILNVQEIKNVKHNLITITKIANAPPHIKGFIYLHDRIIPIVDLRLFYNLKSVEYEKIDVIIILNVSQKNIGIAVDAVSEIVELTPGEIKHPPEFIPIIKQDYIQGIGTIKEKLLIILDIEKLILSKELQVVEQISNITVRGE